MDATPTKDLNISWKEYQTCLLRYSAPEIWLDTSRIHFAPGFFSTMQPRIDAAFQAMADLERGLEGTKDGKPLWANPDEKRMVGHYWLRHPALARQHGKIKEAAQIENDIKQAREFAQRVHRGDFKPASGGKFTDVLVIGIGGSALGPQLMTDALGTAADKMRLHFFDNTDPAGMQRILTEIGDALKTTLTVVISKSGGTPETANGMEVAKAAYEQQGLKFGEHAAVVTGVGSKLDQRADKEGILNKFPMQDWVGGRTSVMHTVGLVPMFLQGLSVDGFLTGAREMDEKTRLRDAHGNMAMKLALAWFSATGGVGAKDMVILPYKDRLALFSKYLQQLVMESLGKELDLDNKVVRQGIAVYGNKGSTDQHSYVQQLRDGVNNFFATFIEVREAPDIQAGGLEANKIIVDQALGATSGDFLQGFLRGTRKALAANGRESVTISIPKVTAESLGALIALFERAVGFYASLVNINAYHQPGVEAGKKAATKFLRVLAKVRQHMRSQPHAQTTDEIVPHCQLEQDSLPPEPADPEDVYHALNHLAANGVLTVQRGALPAEDRFSYGAEV